MRVSKVDFEKILTNLPNYGYKFKPHLGIIVESSEVGEEYDIKLFVVHGYHSSQLDFVDMYSGNGPEKDQYARMMYEKMSAMYWEREFVYWMTDNKEHKVTLWKLPCKVIWEEFQAQTFKNDKQAKSWMYQRTGKRGLITKTEMGWWPTVATYPIIVDGEHKLYPAHVSSSVGLFWDRHSGHYFTMNNTYWIGSLEIPLMAIIQSYEYCEEHDVIYAGECPKCRDEFTVHRYNEPATAHVPFMDDGEKNPLYLGVELEYEDCTTQVAATYKALKGFIIIKRDGSLRNGFEINTAPATLSVHKKRFSGFFTKVKYEVLASCGMHVHVAKKGINEMQQGKLLQFINDEGHKDAIIKIAGRDYTKNNYCKSESRIKATHNIRSNDDGFTRVAVGKYAALNTSPANTLEFRIFASPKDEKELFSRLEFVQAMVDYTRPGNVGIRDLGWPTFVKHVNKFPRLYPNLKGMI